MKLTETLTLLGLGGLIVYLVLNQKKEPQTTNVVSNPTSAADGIPRVLRDAQAPMKEETVSVEDLQEPSEAIEEAEITSEEIVEERVQQRRRPSDPYTEQFVILDRTPFPIYKQRVDGIDEMDSPLGGIS